MQDLTTSHLEEPGSTMLTKLQQEYSNKREEVRMKAKEKGAAEASAKITRNNYNTRKAKYQSVLNVLPNDSHLKNCMVHLIKHKTITSAVAAQLDSNYRLSSTIDILRKKYGVNIRTEIVRNEETGRSYGVYTLEVTERSGNEE